MHVLQPRPREQTLESAHDPEAHMENCPAQMITGTECIKMSLLNYCWASHSRTGTRPAGTGARAQGAAAACSAQIP